MSGGWSFYNAWWNYGSGSNLRTGTNPTYATTDFIAFYPQFGNDSQGNPIIATTVIQTFIDMAAASLQQERWKSWWTLGMALFVAHYCTLYLETSVSADSGADAVYQAGQAQGVVDSESAGDVSVSYDPKLSESDWGRWGDLNLTTYGQQLMTMAKRVGVGGMQIW